MIKTRLLLGAALAAFGIIPVAQADQIEVTQSATWDNSVDVDVAWSVDVTKNLNIDGSIRIYGLVIVDDLAQASLDDKQVIDGNSVLFEDYQNAYQDFSTDGTGAEPGLGQGPGDPNYTEEGSPQGPALYTNTVSAGDGTLSNASGNIGMNMAAGDYNLQENAAVISSADSLFLPGDPEGFGGAAEAQSASLQNLYNNIFNDPSPQGQTPHTAELENTDIDNTVAIGAGLANGADGNIGVNAAAGAFNIQKNALGIATVRIGDLSEAVATTFQDVEENVSVVEDVTNNVSIGASLIGASGNIGVNLAAGVGNLQLNSLTIANALGELAPGTGPVDTGPIDTGPAGGGTTGG
jgi:hypothetical protein